MDTSSMHQHLQQTWSQYFCRDDPKEDHQAWEESIRFLEAIQDFPLMVEQPITGQQLYMAIKKTKIASSRGGGWFFNIGFAETTHALMELNG